MDTMKASNSHAKYKSGNFQAYANVAVAQAESEPGGVEPVPVRQHPRRSPTLGGLTEFQYIQSALCLYRPQPVRHGVRRVRSINSAAGPRRLTRRFGSNGLSWCGTTLSADMIYGSGLRDGDANIRTVPSYTQVNIGIKREFLLPNDPKPMTVRFDVVNVFDSIYEIRDGSGIGVFAPQFGPRRGFFLGISKKIRGPAA